MAKKKTSPTAETKPEESKTQKFVRLANTRVSRVVRMIHNIGNLSGPGYESTPEQRAKIADALESAVAAALARLNKDEVKSAGFSL